MTAAPTFSEFLAVLPHIDRLNSWIRSESARGSRFPIARVIYHFKNAAIKAAIARGIAEHRRLATTIVCRDCNGTKRYRDQYDYLHPHCRLCLSTGSVRLQFIKSTVREFCWLSPLNYPHKSDHFGDWQNLPVFPMADDWRPNLPGRDLSPSDVAESLNAVEAFFPARPPKRWVSYDSYYGEGEYTDDFAGYQLHVGSTPEGECSTCHRALADGDVGIHHLVSQSRIVWTAIVCKSCRELWGDGIWERLRYTGCAALLTPQIREWITRHPTAEVRR